MPGKRFEHLNNVSNERNNTSVSQLIVLSLNYFYCEAKWNHEKSS